MGRESVDCAMFFAFMFFGYMKDRNALHIDDKAHVDHYDYVPRLFPSLAPLFPLRRSYASPHSRITLTLHAYVTHTEQTEQSPQPHQEPTSNGQQTTNP
jgi:hypothetical protein